jgi:hypothetical protein
MMLVSLATNQSVRSPSASSGDFSLSPDVLSSVTSCGGDHGSSIELRVDA